MTETVTVGMSVLGYWSMPRLLTEKRPSTTRASMMQTVKTGRRMEKSDRNMAHFPPAAGVATRRRLPTATRSLPLSMTWAPTGRPVMGR